MKKTESRVTRALRTASAKTLARELTAMSFRDADGNVLSHVKAMDLLAKLEGYNSQGHRRAKAAKSTFGPKAEVPQSQGYPATDIVQEWLAGNREPVDCSKEDWQYEVSNGDTQRSYAQWILARQLLLSDEVTHLPKPTPEETAARELYLELVQSGLETRTFTGHARDIRVIEADGRESVWKLEPNLSSREGLLNDSDFEKKPGLVRLALEGFEAVCSLMDVMAEEATFIAECDGEIGILAEYELYTRESAVADGSTKLDGLLTERETAEKVRRQMAVVNPSKDSPWARFALANPEDYTVFGNTVLMAFVSLADIRKHKLEHKDIKHVVRTLWNIEETVVA